nr:Enriched_in_surface-labeled_proteome_protein_18/GeneDB:LmjF.36.0660 [Leishmania donovani]
MPELGKSVFHVSFHLSRFFFAAVVAALLLFFLSGGSLAGTHIRDGSPSGGAENDTTRTVTTTTTSPTPAAPVSLQEACHTEMKLYCSDHPISPLRCLVEQYYRTAKSNGEEPRRLTSALYSDVCGSWLAAREACLGFVHQRGRELCGNSVTDARECLRQIPPLVLPHACVTSAYYESVRLVGKLRQHQNEDARLRLLREKFP